MAFASGSQNDMGTRWGPLARRQPLTLFHGGESGSIPLGSASKINHVQSRAAAVSDTWPINAHGLLGPVLSTSRFQILLLAIGASAPTATRPTPILCFLDALSAHRHTGRQIICGLGATAERPMSRQEPGDAFAHTGEDFILSLLQARDRAAYAEDKLAPEVTLRQQDCNDPRVLNDDVS